MTIAVVFRNWGRKDLLKASSVAAAVRLYVQEFAHVRVVRIFYRSSHIFRVVFIFSLQRSVNNVCYLLRRYGWYRPPSSNNCMSNICWVNFFLNPTEQQQQQQHKSVSIHGLLELRWDNFFGKMTKKINSSRLQLLLLQPGRQTASLKYLDGLKKCNIPRHR